MVAVDVTSQTPSSSTKSRLFSLKRRRKRRRRKEDLQLEIVKQRVKE